METKIKELTESMRINITKLLIIIKEHHQLVLQLSLSGLVGSSEQKGLIKNPVYKNLQFLHRIFTTLFSRIHLSSRLATELW